MFADFEPMKRVNRTTWALKWRRLVESQILWVENSVFNPIFPRLDETRPQF